MRVHQNEGPTELIYGRAFMNPRGIRFHISMRSFFFFFSPSPLHFLAAFFVGLFDQLDSQSMEKQHQLQPLHYNVTL